MESPARPPSRRGIRRGPRLALLAVAALVPPCPAVPAARPAPAACAPAPGDAAVAPASVADDGDIALADGRVVRLAGIDPGRATAATPDRAARLRAALLGWAAGAGEGRVALHALGGPDRWGRVPALLFRVGRSGTAPPGTDAPGTAPAEAGAVLVEAGLARVAPDASAHACAGARLAAEERARAAGAGLWADPAYAVLEPGDAAGLAAQAGGLAIVRGILRLHESRGALYLSLGRDRRGFAAVVPRRAAKLFARSGLDLRDYVGTPVRLRGDLDARFGPRMRLADPDAVESLEPGSVAE